MRSVVGGVCEKCGDECEGVISPEICLRRARNEIHTGQ